MDITKLVHLHQDLQSLLDGYSEIAGNPDSSKQLRHDVSQLFERSLAGLPLQPEEKTVTILLADIRGFTAIAENYSPIKIVESLNDYFAIMVPIIIRHGGKIDKFMGDSIMALFYGDESVEETALHALTCAVEMQQSMEKVNAVLKDKGMEKLYMGIGINTGDVVCGAIGANMHQEFSVIGDHVNLTARVEAFTLRGQILISENTFGLTKDWIETGDSNKVSVKGKNKEIMIRELLAVQKPTRLEVPERDGRRSPRVNVDFQSNFQMIDGKKIRPDFLPSRIKDISYGGVSMLSDVPLSEMSDIRLLLNFDYSGNSDEQVYAKVLRASRIDQGYNYAVEFTSLSDKAKQSIKYMVDANL